ncbi:hypothetical protein ACWPM1_00690 [Tsuneonella sp. HG249]
MRTSLWVAIGLVGAVSAPPPAVGQDTQVPAERSSASTGAQADARQPKSVDGLTLESQGYAGVFIEAPIGKVSVGPEFVDGAPVYVRRTTATSGITVMEISTSPFLFDLPSEGHSQTVRSDQPASW